MKYEMTIKEACNSGFWSCLTPTDWIQLGAVIISLISVLIALYASIVGRQSAKASEISAESAKKQLEEMINQRKDAVKPELFLEKETFGLKYSQGMDFVRFHHGNNMMNFTITNTGNGNAKRIRFEWDYDEMSSSIKLIKENQKENQYILEYKEGSHVSINNFGLTLLDLDFKQEIPMLSADKNCKIHLPLSYTQILTIMIHLCNTKKLPLEQIPNLKLSLTYADVLGNEYSQKFIFTPHLIPLSSRETRTEVTEYELHVIVAVKEEI
ncbi:hypothetical protein [Bacillus sp. F9_6S_D1_P_5]